MIKLTKLDLIARIASQLGYMITLDKLIAVYDKFSYDQLERIERVIGG